MSKRVTIDVIRESRALVDSLAEESYYSFNLGLILMEASEEERATIAALISKAKSARA